MYLYLASVNFLTVSYSLLPRYIPVLSVLDTKRSTSLIRKCTYTKVKSVRDFCLKTVLCIEATQNSAAAAATEGPTQAACAIMPVIGTCIPPIPAKLKYTLSILFTTAIFTK